MIGADEGAGKGPRAFRVLIVEDDYLASIDLEASLIEAGISVCGLARTADEAIALAGSMRPNAVIMDVRLQGDRSGIDAAIEIYARFKIRSIFATAYDDPALIDQAKDAKPLRWVHKPYQVQNIIDALCADVGQSVHATGH